MHQPNIKKKCHENNKLRTELSESKDGEQNKSIELNNLKKERDALQKESSEINELQQKNGAEAKNERDSLMMKNCGPNKNMFDEKQKLNILKSICGRL